MLHGKIDIRQSIKKLGDEKAARLKAFLDEEEKKFSADVMAAQALCAETGHHYIVVESAVATDGKMLHACKWCGKHNWV